MDYIIDPMFIYWLQVTPNIGWTSLILATILAIIFVIYWASLLIQKADENVNKEYYTSLYDEEKDNKLTERINYSKKPSIYFSIIIILLFIISIFVPSKETMIGMYIAKVATKDNVLKAYKFSKEEIKDLVIFTVGTINGTITNTLGHIPLRADIKIEK